MNVEKFTKDELLLRAEMMEELSKKYTPKSIMYNHVKRTKNKFEQLAKGDGLDLFVVTSMGLAEASEAMQDIKVNIIEGDKTHSKDNVLKYVRKIWNCVFSSEKSMFEKLG